MCENKKNIRTRIEVTKTENGEMKIEKEKRDKFQEMSDEMLQICTELSNINDSEEEGVFEEKILEELVSYLGKHQRIIYSAISNSIFAIYNQNASTKSIELKMGNIQTNISKVSEYAYGKVYTEKIKKKEEEDENGAKAVDMEWAREAIIKIQDHINLAQHQCNSLKQTDEEYKEKFRKNIATFKEDVTKEMNAQLITLVSIFTALAFLLFGGISSLENIFSGINTTSILRLMMLGCIWGISLINLVFVFLFCVSKMTKLPFVSNNSQKSTIFQKYPIFWWTNYIIISIFVLVTLLYYIIRADVIGKLEDIFKGYILLLVIIIAVILITGIYLAKKCNGSYISKK